MIKYNSYDQLAIFSKSNMQSRVTWNCIYNNGQQKKSHNNFIISAEPFIDIALLKL